MTIAGNRQHSSGFRSTRSLSVTMFVPALDVGWPEG